MRAFGPAPSLSEIEVLARATLEWSEGEDSLEHLVAHVLVHEIGHHFGLSDEDMDALEDASGE
jgi:predicted Zn-dependent protease with MMP-like domain